MSATWRLLRTPRWIALTIVAALAVAAFIGASVWQYQRTQDELTVARSALAEPSAYESVVPTDAEEVPLEGLGRQVVVTGMPVPQARSFIRSRLSPSGEAGFWVVDGVRLDDGRMVAVLAGWVARPEVAPEPGPDSSGQHVVKVLGRLQPDENFYPTAPKPVTGPLLTITAQGLSGQWQEALTESQLAPGYVTVTSPPADNGIELVRPVIGSDPDVAFPLQNAFYSLQWLIFAGVVVFVWVRWLREEAQEQARPSGDTGLSDGHVERVSLDR